MKWFVLYTKANFEIKVAQGIKDLGIKSYCPVFTQIKQYSDQLENPPSPQIIDRKK